MFIFDGDCRICSRFARWLAHRLQARGSVVPYQSIVEELPELGLTLEDVQSAAYWHDARGTLRGHRAIAAALNKAGGVWRVTAVLVDSPILRPASAGVYRLVARYRHRLPGGTPACTVSNVAEPPEKRFAPGSGSTGSG